jgi:hypothetical protein
LEEKTKGMDGRGYLEITEGCQLTILAYDGHTEQKTKMLERPHEMERHAPTEYGFKTAPAEGTEGSTHCGQAVVPDAGATGNGDWLNSIAHERILAKWSSILDTRWTDSKIDKNAASDKGRKLWKPGPDHVSSRKSILSVNGGLSSQYRLTSPKENDAPDRMDEFYETLTDAFKAHWDARL